MFKKFIITVLILLNCFMLCSCTNTQKEELTTLEEEIVGKWVFQDAKQLNFFGDYDFFPDGSYDFKSIVNDYYNKATLIFYKEKSNGQVKGELKINNDITTFYWTRPANKIINLEVPLNMYYSTGSGKKSGKITTIYVSDDCTYLNIMFESAKVFYYFDKIL